MEYGDHVFLALLGAFGLSLILKPNIFIGAIHWQLSLMQKCYLYPREASIKVNPAYVQFFGVIWLIMSIWGLFTLLK